MTSNPIVSKKAPKAMVIVGWILTIVPSLLLIMGGVMGIMNPPEVAEQSARLGFSESASRGIGITALSCVALYLFPRTAVLGAILLTAYLGGATATHVRLSEPFVMPIVVGVVIWFGLFFRDARVRALAPWRTRA